MYFIRFVTFAVFFILFSVSTSYAQNKVVVITLGGNDFNIANSMNTKTMFVTELHYYREPPVRCEACYTFFSFTDADDICAADALKYGLTGTYLAWLSDKNNSPASRFTQASVPYALPSGAIVANNWTDLTDGAILAPLNENAGGTPHRALIYNHVRNQFWSATKPDGTLTDEWSNPACDDWLNSSNPPGFSIGGSMEQTDARWSYGGGGVAIRCGDLTEENQGGAAAFLCVEQ